MQKIVAVHRSETNSFSKVSQGAIELIEGEGVLGDAHRGTKIQHRYLVKKNPDQPNFRQVHLIQQELIDDLRNRGFDVGPGAMGENVTTQGVDLLALPLNTLLIFSGGCRLKLTSLRTPCSQLNDYQSGLTKAMITRDETNQLVFKSGIFGVVEKGGILAVGESFDIVLPDEPHEALPPS